MKKLLRINIEKKLSPIALIFMLISFIFLTLILLYVINLKENPYEAILNTEEHILEATTEFLEITTFFSLIYVIILAIMELADNVENFDAYFESAFGYNYFLIIKLISTYLIIIIYYGYIFTMASMLFLIKFKNLKLLKVFLINYGKVTLYAIILYNLAFILIRIFKNYFATLLIFLIFWLTKFFLDSKIDHSLRYLLPRLSFDIQNLGLSFDIPLYYLLIYLLIETTLILKTKP